MGQKTDTKNIFQIGKKNKKYIWNSKFIENKKNESNIFLFQSLEIEKFIKKILTDNGLILYKCKINFFESNIKIFIYYLKLPKSQNIINQINTIQKLRLVKKSSNIQKLKKNIKNYLSLKKYIKKKKNILKHKIIQKLKTNSNQSEKNYKKLKLKTFFFYYFIVNSRRLSIKKYLNLSIHSIYSLQEIKKIINKVQYSKNKLEKITNTLSSNKKKKRIKILQYYKYYIRLKNNKTVKNIKINNFLEKLTESLHIFLNNKLNITISLKQLNNNLTFNITSSQLKYLKKTIIQLRQFKRSKFFKEGINVIFLSIIRKESANLLSNFIANQLKLVKRHNFFLYFLQKTLSLMITSKISKVTSIKIVIKGRLNGKPRSQKKIITINKNMPLMTLKSNIDSTQSVAYGPNGTFGVKIWVNEKI